MGDETKVQMREVAKGAAAMGNVVERYMIRFLGPLGRRIAGATKAGRVMALIGVVAIIVSLVLIVADALTIWTVSKKSHEYLFIRYEMKGYGIPLIAGLALIILGIVQKRK